MRLTKFEQESIIKNSQKLFGSETEVFLFGSRADDDKKGGDIDLYIKGKNHAELLDKKFEFLTFLQNDIGEQKIDIIIATDENREIEQEAIKNGIKL